MTDAVSPALTAWSSFYVITGSSAAALTGLVFVVITLVAGVERVRKAPDGVATFSTPTVVHFCTALFISVVLSAPWHSFVQAAVILGLTGLFGVVYTIRVLLRMRAQDAYDPDAEDWVSYGVLPFVAYVVLVVTAVLLSAMPTQALFALAGVTILLIFIGIRNAWDTVTYIAVGDFKRLKPPD